MQLTLADAEYRASQFASTDRDIPSIVYEVNDRGGEITVLCTRPENEYLPERRTWVIHCAFVDVSNLDDSAATRRAGGQPFPYPIDAKLHEKIYLVDDTTGQVRY